MNKTEDGMDERMEDGWMGMRYEKSKLRNQPGGLRDQKPTPAQ